MSLAQFSFGGLAPTRHQGVIAAAFLIFAAGFMAGAIVRPVRPLPNSGSVESTPAAMTDAAALSPSAAANMPAPDSPLAYPAEVYVCGTYALNKAVTAAAGAAGLSKLQIHEQCFAPPPVVLPENTPFHVTLKRSGTDPCHRARTISVDGAGSTVACRAAPVAARLS